jgi:thiamine-phosphate pyrophosphorylase
MFKKVYPIVNIDNISMFDEKFVEGCLKLSPEYMQIRMKFAPVEEICRVSKKVIWLRNHLNSKTKIIVNDSVEAAILSGADGVHLGQTDDIISGLKNRTERFVVGYSTHTLSEVVKANDLPVDYIGFGPIFKTGTKIQKYGEVFDIADEAVKLSNHSIVFIGGINKRNIESLPCGDKIFYAVVSGLDEILKEVYDAGQH